MVKLQYTQTNDTLCDKARPVKAEPISFDEPMYAQAVFPKSKNDEDKLSSALQRMAEEDQTLHIVNNKETHQTVMYGVGDQHIDVILAKLKSKYKVEVTWKIRKCLIVRPSVKRPSVKAVIRNSPAVMDSSAMSSWSSSRMKALRT